MTKLTLTEVATLFVAQSTEEDNFLAFHKALKVLESGRYIFVPEHSIKGNLGVAFRYTIDDMREYQNDLEHGPKQTFRTDKHGENYTEESQELAGVLIDHFFDTAVLDEEKTFQAFVEKAGIINLFPGVWAVPLPKPVPQVPESPIA